MHTPNTEPSKDEVSKTDSPTAEGTTSTDETHRPKASTGSDTKTTMTARKDIATCACNTKVESTNVTEGTTARSPRR